MKPALAIVCAAILCTIHPLLAPIPSHSADSVDLRRAELFVKQGRAADAIAVLDKYIGANAGDVYARMLRSKCNMSLKRTRPAIDDLNAALGANPRAWWVYNERGRIYMRTGEYKKALSDFDRVLHLEPNTRKTCILRANARAMSGNARRAVIDMQRALELSAGAYSVPADLKEDLRRCLSDARAQAKSRPGDVRADCYSRMGKSSESRRDRAQVHEVGD